MPDLFISFQGHDITLTDVSYYPGYPAKTNALPEDCYPAEPPEIEFTINSGIDHYNELLTEHCLDEITTLALAEIETMEPADL